LDMERLLGDISPVGTDPETYRRGIGLERPAERHPRFSCASVIEI